MRNKKIYLIYHDSQDDCATILGYIEGTEDDAKKYCEKYNAPLMGTYWSKVEWMELPNLSQDPKL